MSSTHAVIYLARGFEPQLADVFLPILRITGKEDLNSLWKAIGMYNTDIYCQGTLQKWTIRQLRGLGFIFCARRGQTILTLSGPAPIDIVFPSNYPRDTSSKEFETKIGVDRVHLRRKFGNILRDWAFKFAIEFHGSEAETVMMADPRRHTVYGKPTSPPALGIPSQIDTPYSNDHPTDEKLVCLLDYMTYSADVVYYVGSGDLRTLQKFRAKDQRRFERVTWFCIDPIVGESFAPNVICMRLLITDPSHLRGLKKPGNLEHMLLWDVRSDKTGHDSEAWERLTAYEDDLGQYVTMCNRDWLSLACLKLRIPVTKQIFDVFTSLIIPQPNAPITMFELRSIVRLNGFSHVDRSHIPLGRVITVQHADCCTLVKNFHGSMRGKRLKRNLLEYLHITQRDGLDHRSGLPRVDLFYLTNNCNRNRLDIIDEILETSALATVWIGNAVHTGYDDFAYSPQKLMLRFCSQQRMVLDGNGFVLFLMWKGALGKDGYKLSYDPAWASQFGVVTLRTYPTDLAPDVSLCRFLGLRRYSTMLRLNTDHVHRKPDILKSLQLDVSGHLLISLISGAYCFDLYWWIKMIRDWSVLPETDKLMMISQYKAEVVEWREDKANEPWHRVEDVRAALILAAELHLPAVSASDYLRWLEMLR
uniref:Core protein VP4 n=8 Tax=Middle Point orbivirus TaxID=464979 RepID=A0A8K1MDP6_9REOV|nr:VP4 [Middle Point orbivirus]UBT83527.1 VP4 [Middle Point orbivirus]UBT83597.1 VP4 [Middle Point orbivirus]UBT83607.1 VP4 [Middle Point orbivirus]UBT83667.1 VP4 [Middle Point orbivirus]